MEQHSADAQQGNQAETDKLVQDDLSKLIGTALGVAGDQIEAHGAFLPVALVVSVEGDISLVAVSPATVEDDVEKDLDADEMIADLYQALTHQKEQNRAAAVVCDIHLPDDDTDAIHIVAEHSSGVSVSAVRPYRQTSEGWEFSDPFLEPSEQQIWV